MKWLNRIINSVYWVFIITVVCTVGLYVYSKGCVSVPPAIGMLARTDNQTSNHSAKTETKTEGNDFDKVASVFMHPRCANCHPAGLAPHVGEEGALHPQNISWVSYDNGLECHSCHKEYNSEKIGIINGPPGAPHWAMPPRATPMILFGKSAKEICYQLKDKTQTGNRDLNAILDHISHDHLVLWAWHPGGNRAEPPISHEAFISAFKVWIDNGAPCPD